MTLRQFQNALNGFRNLEEERFGREMVISRIISFWAFKGHANKKLRRYEQLFELPGDVEARRKRLKGLPEVMIYEQHDQ